MGLSAYWAVDPDGWARRRKVQADLLLVQTETDELDDQVRSLRRQIRAMSRPEVQEHVVRDKLGYVRPGEIVLFYGKHQLINKQMVLSRTP